MDHVTEHPLVQKFKACHDNTGYPPHDYGQKKNILKCLVCIPYSLCKLNIKDSGDAIIKS